jgi:four helix bundle protein
MLVRCQRESILHSMSASKQHGHRELEVWQRAIDLTIEAYAIAKRLPATEKFALASQIRRSASSIPANIAEGNGQIHRGVYLRYLSVARGSLMELDSHLEVAVRIGYLKESDRAVAQSLIQRTGRMLTRLAQALRAARADE